MGENDSQPSFCHDLTFEGEALMVEQAELQPSATMVFPAGWPAASGTGRCTYSQRLPVSISCLFQAVVRVERP